MMSCFRSLLLIASVGGVALSASAADQPVENPVYRNWKNFPVGSKVVYRMTTEAREFREVRITVYRLAEKSDRELTVEMTSVVEGRSQDAPDPQRLTNQRFVDLPRGVKREDFGKQNGASEKGKETIELAGGKYDTEWYVSRVKVEAGETESKTWSSASVPGNLVKSVNTTAATGSQTTIELIKVEIPVGK